MFKSLRGKREDKKCRNPETIYTRLDLPIVPFPGTYAKPSSHPKTSHTLTIPGSSLSGSWTNTPRYFLHEQQQGILHCRLVWWLNIGGTLDEVPPGDWNVEILLKYGSSNLPTMFAKAPRKNIDWIVSVVGPVEQECNSALKTAQVLHLKTGRNAGVSFPTAKSGEWVRYTMGSITIPPEYGASSQVRLDIRGLEDDAITNFSFGGLELKQATATFLSSPLPPCQTMRERHSPIQIQRQYIQPPVSQSRYPDQVRQQNGAFILPSIFTAPPQERGTQAERIVQFA